VCRSSEYAIVVASLLCCVFVRAGPLVLHVAKLFPKNDASSFDAYGRIFSGTLRPGDEVRGGSNQASTCVAYDQTSLSCVVGSSAAAVCAAVAATRPFQGCFFPRCGSTAAAVCAVSLLLCRIFSGTLRPAHEVRGFSRSTLRQPE
jgi:translation elongation factor EF-G